MTSPSIKRRTLLSGLFLLPAGFRLAEATSSVVTLDYAQKHQIIEGFGTCIDTWDAEVAAVYRKEDFLELYLNTLGASVLRIELWGGLAPIARERWEDISWRDFRFEGRGKRGVVTAEVAKQLNAASNSSLRIIASTWSPPAWMKVNGSLGNGHPSRKNFALNLGNPVERGNWSRPVAGAEGNERFQYLAVNRLRRDRYMHFAKLLVEWMRYYRSLGIRLYAMSPTNEPLFSHWFESCVYTPGEYAELVETIAWMFANQGEPPIPIFGPEHMTWDVAGNRQYLDALNQRPGARQALAAIASHGYVDGYAVDMRRESTTAFRKLATPYGKKAWVTEGGFGGHEWPVPLHQLSASFLYALRDGNVSLLTTWQTLTRYPPNEHGLMSVRGPTKKTYAAMQFWRFIRPGMTRIGLDADGGLEGVAFEDASAGKTTLVLLNRTGRTAPVSLRAAGKRLFAIEKAAITDASRNFEQMTSWNDLHAVPLPSESITTLVLKTSAS